MALNPFCDETRHKLAFKGKLPQIDSSGGGYIAARPNARSARALDNATLWHKVFAGHPCLAVTTRNIHGGTPHE